MIVLSVLLREIGLWDLLLAAGVFVVLNGRFSFEYPRSKK
jgi:hypothetical protein